MTPNALCSECRSQPERSFQADRIATTTVRIALTILVHRVNLVIFPPRLRPLVVNGIAGDRLEAQVARRFWHTRKFRSQLRIGTWKILLAECAAVTTP
jgi:hypothetical protein